MKMNLKSPLSMILMALFFLTATSKSFAQEKLAKLKDFKIIVEKTENGIKMKSQKGSAWLNLSFSLNEDQSQIVDEFGMTELKNASKNKDEKLTYFLFKITKTKNGVELKGIEGTAWTDLKFSLTKNEQKAINQFGMTSL